MHGQGTGGKGSTRGSEWSRHLGVAPGPGPENKEQLGWAQGGSGGQPSSRCGNRDHVHHTPGSGSVCGCPPPPQAHQREACNILWGFFPLSQEGGPGWSCGLWQCFRQELLPTLRVRGGRPPLTEDEGHNCVGVGVHTCVRGLLSDSPISTTSV